LLFLEFVALFEEKYHIKHRLNYLGPSYSFLAESKKDQLMMNRKRNKNFRSGRHGFSIYN
jgi:hypothetical protein